MAVINVTAGTEAILTLAPVGSPADAIPGATNGFIIPLVSDITVNASPGIVRYSVLDNASSKAFTTVNENSISGNMLLDEDTFFGPAAAGGVNTVADNGLFKTSVDKTEVSFSIAFQGSDAGDHYISGQGFISGLAPTASMDAAIWLTPLEIVCNGELAKALVV
tara:strand:- start:181 stop:672 length:492 start_codon:yes stop_codon:yes gene_type:complete